MYELKLPNETTPPKLELTMVGATKSVKAKVVDRIQQVQNFAKELTCSNGEDGVLAEVDRVERPRQTVGHDQPSLSGS